MKKLNALILLLYFIGCLYVFNIFTAKGGSDKQVAKNAELNQKVENQGAQGNEVSFTIFQP